MPTDEEVRVTSATGGMKGKKLAQLGAIDPSALLEVARVAGFGTEKYDRYNFLKGYPWSLSWDAMQRHALAFLAGEDTDPESGLNHMAHAAWHALALVAFAQRAVGTDDRPVRPVEGYVYHRDMAGEPHSGYADECRFVECHRTAP